MLIALGLRHISIILTEQYDYPFKKLMVLLLCFLLSACGKQALSTVSPDETEEATRNIKSTDCDRAFAYDYLGYAVCSTERTIYYAVAPAHSKSSWIWFWDQKTGLTMPLCGKADCSHTASSCDAYFNGTVRCLSVYDGRLFWLGMGQYGEYSVFSSAPDGSAREEYFVDNNKLMQEITADRRAFIHRGYVYFYGQQTIVKDGDPIVECCLVRCPVTGGAAEEVCRESVNYAMHVQALGDSLFVVASKQITVEEKENTIIQIDCKSLEQKCLFNAKSSYLINNIWVTKEGVFLSGLDENKIYLFDFDTQQITVPFAFDSENAFLSQLFFGDDYIVAQQLTESYDLLVTDFAGNVLLKKSYSLEVSKRMKEWGAYIAIPQGIDQNSIYVVFHEGSRDQYSYLIRFPLDGSDPVVLWSEQ